MARCSTQDVRGRLLNAGVSTFSRSGFNGSSVQDITDAAGVPKGSFYNHFESKEALGVAALDLYWSDSTCNRLRILEEAGSSPLQRLRRYFELVASDVAGQNFTCGCLAANMAAELCDHSPTISARLASIFASWNDRVATCLREAQQCGELRRDADADLMATFLLDAWKGAVLRARIEKGARPFQQFSDVLFTQLLR